MAYDTGLAERMAGLIGLRPDMEEKKMFGGIVWMLNGNMCVGGWRDYLIVRIGVEAADAIMSEPGVSAMDITGKPMKGWAKVAPDGVSDDEELGRFISLAIDFVGTLPVK